MRIFNPTLLALSLLPLIRGSLACSGCFGPVDHVEHVRHVKRMQPDAINATYGPTRALEWGQLNFLHTTDTHGWLEGHLKQGNYGADWGDFVTFSTHFKHQAGNMGVDILLVDTGDLHDGAGLSDATTPDGAVSMTVFDKVEYDLLTIGNHELYLATVAYQAMYNISTYWGEKYLTSNVQILNPETNEWQYIGNTHRYFTTQHGLRVMAFGVLFDFTGNTNVSKVIPAKTMVTQQWFLDILHSPEPVDVFIILGHNPARPTDSISTFPVVFDAIRAVYPDTPIQFMGGHTHIRDFAVLDASSTAMESGRYCETLGWFSMSGFDSKNSGYHGIAPGPAGVPNPTRKATQNSTSPFVYSRRYLDWNRRTFEYHAATWYDEKFDYNNGLAVSSEITKYRKQLNLTDVYGCTPKDYCMTCTPFNSTGNIFPLLSDALSKAVVNESRQDIPRFIIANTGSVRFDMYKGPFTYDDQFIVSPFLDHFLYIPGIPYSLASTLLQSLNNAGASQKRSVGVMPIERDICVDPSPLHLSAVRGGESHGQVNITKRQVVDLAPGYTTKDDFGTDGDDTAHTGIPHYDIPDFFQGKAGFDEGTQPDVVDVVFVDFIESDLLAILGSNYSSSDVSFYIDESFTTRDYLPIYVKNSQTFQAGLANCTSG
ncbi:Metallo-dependent phosphatase-like protein [Annulohypoxylon maeteangense]|uniref:Metallo-dependent phosphatase-like protein n=1 Tax=Annulohypoxylon maeteangense TaxID=1927788 RepID=UPI0020073868|nr:Metallo-dependent phosphatase-like protein [Annulohypoxylon maeteangense]KAI0883330.1 Metallo-dependent phosphatase-like protein [Annulohypoxylon maeteangense]